MKTYTAYQTVKHYEVRQRQAVQAIQLYRSLIERCQKSRAALAAEERSAAKELAQAYLPQFDQVGLDRAERLTGYRGFSRRSPTKAMAHERQVLTRRIAVIESDERFVDRERLVGRHGTRVQALEEAQSMLQPWEAECEKFEKHEGFLELIEVKYDTPEFDAKWWTADYWRFWARGDAICEQMEMNDFGDDVLPAYNKVEEQRAFWRESVAKAQRAVEEVHNLVRERDRAIARLPALESIYLDRCHQVLGGFLVGTDLQLLAEWLEKEPPSSETQNRPIRAALRKLAGIKAKVTMFGEFEQSGLQALVDDLQDRVRKYSRKVEKFSRPKYIGRNFIDRDLDLKFGPKYQKLKDQHVKMNQLFDRIERFDDYEKFDLAKNDSEAWWFAFIGKNKSPPRLLPRTRRWYDRSENIDHRYQNWMADDYTDFDDDDETAEAVALAAMANELDDGGYLS